MKNQNKLKSSPEIVSYEADVINKIANDMVNTAAKVKKGEHVLVFYDIGARQLAMQVAAFSAKKGARVIYRVRDLDVEETLIRNLTETNLKRLYSYFDNEIFNSDVVFLIRALRDPSILKNVGSERMTIYNEIQKPVYTNYRIDSTRWNLIYMPTHAEAEIENMKYEDYVELYFSACDQPWKEIKKAQDLVKKVLDKGKRLTLIADPENKDSKKRTFLEMSIEGIEFYSSTILVNYPGAEVFASPVRNSVNGQLFAPGLRPLEHQAKYVSDVYFEVKDGKIVKAHAGKGEADMLKLLDSDDGARYFGEVALGTNPGLRRNVFNGLLNEKVGGSFHITPGFSYKDREDEDGNIVHLDNGNRSVVHWDITVMMLPEYGGGEVVVDGKTIQKNGKFLLSGTEVLNKGLK